MRSACLALFLAAAGCGSSTGPSTFSAINTKTLGPSCTFSSCHSANGAASADKLDLQTDPYTALVNMPAVNPQAKSEGKLLVKPGDSANSFLYIKLTLPPGPGNICPTQTPQDVMGYGGCMPQTAPLLDADVLAGIKQWIDSGAPNN